MVDKIIRVAEITMWSILSLFIIYVAYYGLGYVESFIDFKPNAVGPTFAIEKVDKESILELDEESSKYIELEIENVDDTKTLVTLKPVKATSKNFNAKLIDKIKNEDWTDETEGTYKINKIYSYEVKVTKVAVN
ncbi:MAG: hypothetical protein MJ244_05680, partial [Clostridia bacterium]|nr:hypothetical protein [Clostridia bacterium]